MIALAQEIVSVMLGRYPIRYVCDPRAKVHPLDPAFDAPIVRNQWPKHLTAVIWAIEPAKEGKE